MAVDGTGIHISGLGLSGANNTTNTFKIGVFSNDINGANSGGIRTSSQNQINGRYYSISGFLTRSAPATSATGATINTDDGIILDGTNNNNFTSTTINLNNDASSSAFAAAGARAGYEIGAGNLGSLTLVPVGGGATITCP